MRVAMIHTPFQNRTGGERQILRLAIELQKMGHEVEIFTNFVNRNTYPKFFDQVKINVVPYPLAGKVPPQWVPEMIPATTPRTSSKQTEKAGFFSKKWSRARKLLLGQYYVNHIPYMLALGRKIPKEFDIINNHNFVTEWAGFVAKNRLKVPLVWMCNEPPYWFFAPDKSRFRNINWPVWELIDRAAVDYVDEIMVLSHVSEGYVRKAYDRSSTIVRTGVDVELLQNATGQSLREKYNLHDSFVLLFVGGSIYARRSDIIRALAILTKKHEHIKLIIDTPRDREMLASLATELGLKDKVILLNSKTDQELAEVYATSDCFIYPSSASPWGLVVTEAMAAAKPVIISKQVGTSEIITNFDNGIVIDDATPERIAEQVTLLLENPKLRRKLGENAYKYVKENLSWRKYAERVEAVFVETMARPQRK
jgi:glycosyltransferase involved in cell wall biosynthesis